jgi:hypothetical protein
MENTLKQYSHIIKANAESAVDSQPLLAEYKIQMETNNNRAYNAQQNDYLIKNTMETNNLQMKQGESDTTPFYAYSSFLWTTLFTILVYSLILFMIFKYQ